MLYQHCVWQKVLDLMRFLPRIEVTGNINSVIIVRLIPEKRDQSRSLLSSITKWILLRSPKMKSLRNPLKYGRLPITAKQHLAIAIPSNLKITHNNQT